MATSLKKNVPATTVAAIMPETAMRNVVAHVIAFRRQAIETVCAMANYFLFACYLNPVEKDRLNLTDAAKEIDNAIKKAAGVKGDMMNIYRSRAKAFYSWLTEGNKYPVIIQEIAKFPNTTEGAEKAVQHLVTWLDANHGIKTLKDLSASLGYVLPSPTRQQGGDTKTPAQSVQTGISNALKAAAKIATEKNVPRAVIPQAVASAVPVNAAITTAEKILDRYAQTDKADPAALLDLVKFVEKLVDVINARHKQDKAPPMTAAEAEKAKRKPATVASKSK